MLKKLEMFQAVEKDSPRPEKYSVECTDAWNQGLGGVRTQDNRIVEPRRSSKSYHSTSERKKEHHDPDEATWELEDVV